MSGYRERVRGLELEFLHERRGDVRGEVCPFVDWVVPSF